jgi:hypothetical protein
VLFQKFNETFWNELLARALAGWEDEGGASQPKSENNQHRRAALAEEDEHVLRCLGAAVIMHWNDLPTTTGSL